MKRLCILILGLMVCWSVSAQSPTIEWQKALGGSSGDYAYSVQQTTDGGYIVAGNTGSNNGDVSGNNGNADYWVVKLISTGNIEWQKAFGGSSTEFAESIQQTTDGGYIVAGYSFSDDGDVFGNNGSDDYWIIKLNSVGDTLWTKTLGGTSRDWANSIQQTTDGGYIIAGWTQSNDMDVAGNKGGADYWIVKLDSVGTIEWQKALGGTADEQAQAVLQTTDGGYIIAGFTDSNNGDVSGNNGLNDYWIVKLSSTSAIEY